MGKFLINFILLIVKLQQFNSIEASAGVKQTKLVGLHGLVFHEIGELLLTSDKYIIVLDEDYDLLWKGIELIEGRSQIWFDSQVNLNGGQYDLPVYRRLKDAQRQMLAETVRKIRKEIKDIQLIVTPNTKLYSIDEGRRKRGAIPFVGSALQLLFGVVLTDDMNDIHAAIGKLTKTNDKLISISEKQAVFLNNTYDLAIDTANKLKLFIDVIYTYMYTEEVMLIFGYTLQESLNACNANLRDMRRALEMAATGRLSQYFLPPEIFIEALNWIENKLPLDTQMLAPTNRENLHIYYNNAHVTCGTNGINKIRLFVHIPLSAPNRYFTLYKPIPFPIVWGDTQYATYIQPESEYFGITIDRQYYINMDSNDLLKCHSKTIRICDVIKPIRKPYKPSCLFSLFNGIYKNVEKLCDRRLTTNLEPVFLKSGDEWLYSVPEPISVFLHCPVSRSQTRVHNNFDISGTGSLKIPPDCYLHGDSIKLLPRVIVMKNHTVTRDLHVIFPSLFKLLNNNETAILKNGNLSKILHQTISNLEKSTSPSSTLKGASINAIMNEIKNAKVANEEAKVQLENSITHFASLNFSFWPSITVIVISLAALIGACILCNCICKRLC